MRRDPTPAPRPLAPCIDPLDDGGPMLSPLLGAGLDLEPLSGRPPHPVPLLILYPRFLSTPPSSSSLLQTLRVAASASRPVWLPGQKPPSHLNGSLPGDRGFDVSGERVETAPLNLSPSSRASQPPPSSLSITAALPGH